MDKAYEAVVEGVVADDEGLIDKALLRVDAVKNGRATRPASRSWRTMTVAGANQPVSRVSSYKVLERETVRQRRVSMAWRSMRRFSTNLTGRGVHWRGPIVFCTN